ncbi:MAG: BBP7 family outer membrane beta-barrel protein [Gemmataceae bacterium]
MRNRLLGSIAAVTAGAGAALGQTPPPPAPIGAVGGPPMVMPAGGPVDPIPPQFGGGMGGPMMGGDPSGGLMPGGPAGMGPVGYPPPGMYGQPPYEAPFSKNADAYNTRFAPKVWVNTEYLLWFTRAMPNNFPAITSGPPVGFGVPGTVGTTTAWNREDYGFGLASGFRVTGGFFKDPDRRRGWYASGFLVEQKSSLFQGVSDQTGQPLFARPYINAGTGGIETLIATFPTVASGVIVGQASTRAWGAEGGPVVNLYRTCPDDARCLFSVDLLSGFRYLEIDEQFRVQQFTNVLNGVPTTFDGKQYVGPVTIEVNDEFKVANQFYGGQLGLATDFRWGRLSLAATGKVAIGVMHQRLEVNGVSRLIYTDANGFPAVSTATGGLYANPANVGRFNNDEFAVIPEANVQLGYSWASWLSTFVGYNFLYSNRVARASEQYSPVVNPATIPASPSYGLGGPVVTPNPIFTQNDYWLQGVSFGFVVRY